MVVQPCKKIKLSGLLSFDKLLDKDSQSQKALMEGF